MDKSHLDPYPYPNPLENSEFHQVITKCQLSISLTMSQKQPSPSHGRSNINFDDFVKMLRYDESQPPMQLRYERTITLPSKSNTESQNKLKSALFKEKDK